MEQEQISLDQVKLLKLLTKIKFSFPSGLPEVFIVQE